MGTSIFLCLFVILLIGGAPVRCAGDSGSAGDGGSASNSTANPTMKPILLNNTADAEAFISGAEVVVVGFFQEPESSEASQFRLAADRIPEVPFGLSTSPEVLSHYGVAANTVKLFRMIDNDQRDLDLSDSIDVEKMIQFVRMNELRLVTDYNPVTAIGVMHSSLQFNLLLITDKMSPKHPERMSKYRAAAELYKGKTLMAPELREIMAGVASSIHKQERFEKPSTELDFMDIGPLLEVLISQMIILFILIDINLKSNEYVMSFFKVKKSQLPALAMFHTPDEEQDVLTLDELSVERVQDFCNRFLQRIQKKKEDELEEKALNDEL